MTSAFGFRACSRCDRKYKGRGAWNVTAERGEVVGILCPSCQSPAENAEAEINAATLEYATLDDGRIVGRPKTSE